MRKEPFYVNSFVHVYNRGNKKQKIVRDNKDRQRFLQMLYYFNDEYSPENLFRTLELSGIDYDTKLIRPNEWPSRKPLVKILAFTLLDNHFHLLLKEIKEGGITKFMRKLGTGMTNRFNTRYKESGRLFQGAYKARCVDNDNYLQYLSVYIQVKNLFELYKGGLQNSLNEFDKAYEFAIRYPYSSLADYASNKVSSPIIDKDILGDIFSGPLRYKEFSKDCMETIDFDNDDELNHLILDN